MVWTGSPFRDLVDRVERDDPERPVAPQEAADLRARRLQAHPGLQDASALHARS